MNGTKRGPICLGEQFHDVHRLVATEPKSGHPLAQPLGASPPRDFRTDRAQKRAKSWTSKTVSIRWELPLHQLVQKLAEPSHGQSTPNPHHCPEPLLAFSHLLLLPHHRNIPPCPSFATSAVRVVCPLSHTVYASVVCPCGSQLNYIAYLGHVGTDWDCVAVYPTAGSEAPSPLPPPESAPLTPLAVPLTFREEILASCSAVASLVTHSSEEYRAIVTSRHGRKRKEGHIPRPPNAFMIYRSHMWSQRKITSALERDHRNISKIVGHCWNELDDIQRAPYKAMADEAKRRHAELYPDYKYAPLSRREKAPKRKVKADTGSEEARCKTVAALLGRGVQGVALENEMARLSLKAVTADAMDGNESDYTPRKPRKASRSSFSRPFTTRRRSGPVKKAKSRRQIKREVSDTHNNIETPVHAPTPDSVPAIENSPSPAESEIGFISTEAIPPLDLSEETVRVRAFCFCDLNFH